MKRAAFQAAKMNLAKRRAAGSAFVDAEVSRTADALVMARSSVLDARSLATFARRETREANAVVKAQEVADDEAMAEFKSTVGAQWVASLSTVAPQLIPTSGQLVPIPHNTLMQFGYIPDLVADVTDIASCAAQGGRASNLQQALQLDWDHRMQSVSGSVGAGPVGAAMIGDEDGPKARDECRMYGVCVCSDEGKPILKMEKKFMVAFKHQTQRGSIDRTAMVEGKYLLRLTWQEVRDAAEDGSGAAAGGDLRQGDEYWHIGNAHLAPCRPTFQVLDLIAMGDDEARLELKATWRVLPLRHAIEPLDRSLKL